MEGTVKLEDYRQSTQRIVSRGGHSHRRRVQSCDRGQDAVKRSRHFLGVGQTVKQCSGALSTALPPIKRRGRSFCACAVNRWSRVKGKNPAWSSGQGRFSTVKNLDPGRSSGHSAYGSDPPLLYDGGHCVSPSGDLYVYGGCDGSAARGGLYKLQLSSLEWSQLSGESDENGPAKNVGCRMVYFDKNKLAVVGGYALPPAAPLQPGARASLTDPDKCSTIGKNEIHIFDTDECK